MKPRWVRPRGCACPLESPVRERCNGRWIRCNARIRYERQNVRAPLPSLRCSGHFSRPDLPRGRPRIESIALRLATQHKSVAVKP